MSAVSRHGPDAASLTLPGEPASVTSARHHLATFLDQRGVDGDLRDTAELLVTEVVTNAVLHAQSEVTVRWSFTAASLLVEVTDLSPLMPTRREHDTDAVSGRGLELVEMLAEGYGVRAGEGGKTVWFTVGTPPDDVASGWLDPADDDTRVVRLREVPYALYDVLSQHNEALLKEYELFLIAQEASAAQRQELSEAARARALLASSIRQASGDLVELKVPQDMVPGFRALPLVLNAAEQAAAAGQLLTRPALPELLEFRHWLYRQIAAQLGGDPTVSWAVDVRPRTGTGPAGMDLAWVATVPDAVVVADDLNHVVAASPAVEALLGWPPADLVGERITALVPPELRLEHVTGFTRHLVSGTTTIMGRDVVVSALHRSGRQVPVRLRLEQAGVGGTTLFVARLVAAD